MSNKTKLLGLIIAIALISAVIAVGGVIAQDSDDDTPPYGPMGRGMGMGMMHRGFDSETPMHSAVAEALGIDADTLWTELHSGNTIAALAEEKGVDLQVVKDAMIAAMTDHLNTLVEAGYITQAQADARLSAMQENIDLHLTAGCTGGGMMGHMHGGMGMGAGRHGRGFMRGGQWQ